MAVVSCVILGVFEIGCLVLASVFTASIESEITCHWVLSSARICSTAFSVVFLIFDATNWAAVWLRNEILTVIVPL
jgi:hypothetical protein